MFVESEKLKEIGTGGYNYVGSVEISLPLHCLIANKKRVRSVVVKILPTQYSRSVAPLLFKSSSDSD